MKHYTLLPLLVLMCASVCIAEDKTPDWIKQVPNSNNKNFYYFVATATASTESIALNKTLGMALQNADMNTGSRVSSQDVQLAVEQGTVETMAHSFEIPINKVCDFRMKAGDGVRVYALYQIASAGNVDITFPPFTACGDPGDLSIISTRPEEWAIYETNRYFSSYHEAELAKKQSENDLQNKLNIQVRKMLVSDIHLDTTLTNLIRSEVKYNPSNKTAYGIAYIERSVVLDTYEQHVEDEMETADILMEQIRSRIEEGDEMNAKAMLDRLRGIFKELDGKINFIHAYATSRKMNRLNEDRKELDRQCKELALSVAGNHQDLAESKIRDYIRNAHMAERQGKIGDVLRYLYAAQVLIADLPNAAAFSHTIKTPSGEQKVNANTYVQQRISDILGGIRVSFDGFLPDSETEGKLSFLYDRIKPDGTTETVAVSNLNFTYNDNTGWSEDMPVKDGWSIVQMPANNKPSSLHVKIDYKYVGDAASDPDLQNKMQKYKFDYDKKAMQIIPVKNTAISLTAKDNVPAKASTNMLQNSVVKNVTQKSHLVSSADSVMYSQKVNDVLNAIETQKYESVYNMFTPSGYDQFERLIKYGKARIITRSAIRFVRCGGDVQCRYVPMMFTFSKGKNTLENVVFTFDKQQKIDGIQFALEERSARNIMADTRYSETSQLVLVNFMENYKTAFALKRLDYIESIFADDAVIITGRILQKSDKPVDANQVAINSILYKKQTKKEYLARLASSFSSKEWINIKFGNTDVEKSAQGEQFGIRLLQDYSSNNYGDRGYLFLLIDCENQDAPLIRVRTWQPETEGSRPFSLSDYDELTAPKY